MERVAFDDLEPEPHDEYHADRRDLSAALGTEGVAIARYVLEPGERFSGSVHAHADQEEVFVVLADEATFETGVDGDREVTVAADEAIRFAPGEFQTGRNVGDEPLVALALGAPRETADIRISRIPTLGDREVVCPDCTCDHMQIASERDAAFVCPECGATADLE